MYGDKYVADALLLSLGALAILDWWITRALQRGDHRERPTAIWAGIACTLAGGTSALSLPGGLLAGGDPFLAQALSLGSLLALSGLDLALTGVASVRAALAFPAESQLRQAARSERRGEYADAATHFLEAVPPLRRGGQPHRELSARLAGAHALLESGAAEAAAACYQGAVTRAEEAGDLGAAARAQLGLGDAASELGRVEQARTAFQDAARAAQRAADRPLAGWAFNRLAWLEYAAGDHPLARAYLGWAAALDPRSRDEQRLASQVLLAGCLALAEGRLDVARAALEDAVRFAQLADDPVAMTKARVALGCAHYVEGFTESGRAYVEGQLAGRLDLAGRRLVGTWLLGLAMLTSFRAPDDSTAFAEDAIRLLAGHPVLEPLARHAAKPAGSPELGPAAAAVARLLNPTAPAAAPSAVGA